MEETVENNNTELRNHRAGFVSIIGKPNVGKSTLMNVLVGERMSIITSKAQTTRHRIIGILNGKHEDIPFQLVYSDTPGVIKPSYKLHDSMMTFVKGSLEDADVVLFVVEIGEKAAEHEVLPLLKRTQSPVVLVLNKIDLSNEEEVKRKTEEWENEIHPAAIVPISALENANIGTLFDAVVTRLPFHPPYFDEDELTDKPERFFASEIIREKIFLNYRQEIPYSSEVVITEFKDKDDIIVIRAEILVERKSQKGIIIGEKGEMLKKVGTQARQDLEDFFGKKVFLEQHVKVEPDWRSKENKLRQLGYQE
ncbi:GTPase Era [Dyadobacter sp. CY261]|uniref:GTPase Era n=1 Tax=Dyadobacter sp. CY261 TaxID=2907203 RepID=UPI001F3AB17E|nr:GTPase Era [Dyadobacter sp. CY261]MCF0072641.1 GTPase Era [Dyadobacter sp. CY261]